MEIFGYNTGQQDKRYLKQLLKAATNYTNATSNRFYEISFFYRNKSEEYFREARRNNNVLKKLRKDNNGDPRSPINGKLSGVFFSVTLFQGSFPSRSPFGNIRVHIPIEAIFRESENLYFTDFYCYGNESETHYVTLVLTPRGSKEDIFCTKTLLKLDPVENPFLRRPNQYTDDSSHPYQIPTFSTVRKSKFFVEVFYTEDINLNQLTSKYGPEKVFYSTTGIIGRGHSTWGGLRKKASCTVCNPPKLPSVDSMNQNLQSLRNYGTIRVADEIQRPNVSVQHQVKPPTNTMRPAIRSEPSGYQVPNSARNYRPPAHQNYGTIRVADEIQRPNVSVQHQVKPPTNTMRPAIRSEPSGYQVPNSAGNYRPPAHQNYGTIRVTDEIQRPTVRVQPQARPPTSTTTRSVIRSEPLQVPKSTRNYRPPAHHTEVEFLSPRQTVYSTPVKKERKHGCCNCTIL